MTEQAMAGETPDNPLLKEWDAPFAAPPFADIRPSISGRPSTRRSTQHRARDRRDRRQSGRAGLRQHHRRAGAERPHAQPRRLRLLQPRRGAHQRRDPGDRARHGAAPRPAPQRHLPERGAVPPGRRPGGAARRRSALTPEQARVLERYHTIFVRQGAALRAGQEASGSRRSPSGWRRSARNSARTCSPTRRPTRWCWRARTTSPACRIRSAQAAAKAADERGLAGKHVITLSRSSIEPFLQFSSRRDLRETAFKAWTARGENGGATDNRPIIAEMVALRAERARAARLSRASRISASTTRWRRRRRRRSTSSHSVWQPARAQALREADALQALIQAEGGNFALAPWDWRYYAEKRRKAEFDFDESEIKPYLQLDNMIEAAFDTAATLFGLSFSERHDVPLYHPDVRAWEVTGPRRPPRRPLPRRLFRPALEAERRLDERLPRPGEARRRHPADRRQRDEFLQGRRRRDPRSSASTTRARSSTNSATRCTAFCPT